MHDTEGKVQRVLEGEQMVDRAKELVGHSKLSMQQCKNQK